MSSITRDEYKTYLRIKGKLLFKNAETQTDEEEPQDNPIISSLGSLPKNSSLIIINAMPPGKKRIVDSDEDSDDDFDYEEGEEGELRNEVISTDTDEEVCCDSKKKTNKKKRKICEDYDRDEYKYY